MNFISHLSSYFSLSKALQLAFQPLLTILNLVSHWAKVENRGSLTSPYALELIRQSFYKSNYPPDSDFYFCAINFHLRLPSRYWLCKVTFRGALPATVRPSIHKIQQDLEDLCRCIDFQSYTLLDDTITEFVVTRDSASPNSRLRWAPQTSSDYSHIATELSIHVQEDPSRVVFPPFDYPPNVQVEAISRVQKIQRLQEGVHRVRLGDSETTYVYKEVERPLYVAGDSQVLEREFQNLQILRGTRGIVQLVAAIVSDLPYQTRGPAPCVLRGILLEYHPNGTLSSYLESNVFTPWSRWALQVAEALSYLHDKDIPHMDIKPGNIVISEEGDAVLIDVSGMGFTYEWLSSEMVAKLTDVDDILSMSLDLRKSNDIWALGKIFGKMASASSCKEEKELLRSLELAATDKPVSRIHLDGIIHALRG